jgi:hypothetical protein
VSARHSDRSQDDLSRRCAGRGGYGLCGLVALGELDLETSANSSTNAVIAGFIG